MNLINQIIVVIGIIFGVLNFHKSIQFFTGLFSKARRYPETQIFKKYGIVIPARNEQKVIGNLIESIKNQTYNQNLIDIFVVADNCTDQTAEIAKSMCCKVYERFDERKKRKGWAMEYLFDQIEKDYGIESYDAYFIFDADNLLEPDFIHEMNKAFVVNQQIVTSYRNSKNFETNWVSAAYGIHFYGRTVYNHRPRNFFGTGTHLSGTGFVISSHLLKDGWHYYTLTEDSELTMYMTSQNIKIGYCEQAVHYDEQPTSFRVGFRQRVRWTRGRLVVFMKTWKMLLKGVFNHKSFTNYDMLFYIMPYPLLTFLLNVSYGAAALIIAIWINHTFSWSTFVLSFGIYWGGQYISNLIRNAMVVVREREQIHCGFYKTLFYIVISPWFQMISIFLMIVALFGDVQWIPVKHNDSRKIDKLKEIKNQLNRVRDRKFRLVRSLRTISLMFIIAPISLYVIYEYLFNFNIDLKPWFYYGVVFGIFFGFAILFISYTIEKRLVKKMDLIQSEKFA